MTDYRTIRGSENIAAALKEIAAALRAYVELVKAGRA